MTEFRFKMVLIGPAAVGKTSLLHRFVSGQFSESYMLTIGVEFLTKEIKFKRNNVKLTIWDIGGQKKFQNIRTTFYRNAKGALLVFDLTRADTFGEVEAWLTEMYEVLGAKIPFVLIGNKTDLIKDVGRVIDGDKAKNFAESRGSIYIETSAKTGENVEDAFIELSRQMAGRNIELILKKGKKQKNPKEKDNK